MRLILGFLIGLVLAAIIAATAFKVAWGDIGDFAKRDRGEDVTQSVEAADFTEIAIKGVFELDVTVGADYSVTLPGSEEDLARTTAEVQNGRLVLDSENRKEQKHASIIKHGVTAVVTLPALNGLDVEGVVDGDIRGVNADTFSADIAGVGEIEFAGECVTLDADISGVGEVDAEKLECRNVSIDMSGIGEAKVYASESVDADLTGIGQIEVYGSPANVSKTKTGPFGRVIVK